MDKQFNVFLRNAIDTEANWNERNPVLQEGELAVVLEVDGEKGDTRLKAGDGVSPFTSLQFLYGLPSFLERVLFDKPVSKESLQWTGDMQTPTLDFYDPDKMTLSGDITATDAGEYEITAQLKHGYYWPNLSTDSIVVPWKIERAPLEAPVCVSELVFTGAKQEPAWSNTQYMTATSGSTSSAVNAGIYYGEFLPDGNHMWSDGSITAKRVPWTIARAVIEVPVCTSSRVYTGRAQSPTWSNTQYMSTTSGHVGSATNAGTYYGEFLPDDNHMWPDKTTAAKKAAWTIGKANGTLSISTSEMEIIKDL